MRTLRAADSKHTGSSAVCVAGVSRRAWKEQLPHDFPPFLLDVLGLYDDLDWLHLAVLSGNVATVKFVHSCCTEAERGEGRFPPGLLSLFAQPTTINTKLPPTYHPLRPLSSKSITDLVVGKACTAEFIRDAWAVGIAFTNMDHLFQLTWHLACLSAKRPEDPPFQFQTHLSLMPPLLPDIVVGGLLVCQQLTTQLP